MPHQDSLVTHPLGALIKEIASNEIAPGAGSAAAVGLALAAACAGKAVAISLKHREHDRVLSQAAQTLAAIAERALSGADEDAKHFRALVKAKDSQAAHRLIESGTHLQQVADALRDVLDAIESSVVTQVSGDLRAARVLCDAFSEIQTSNLAENSAALDSSKSDQAR